MMSGYEWDDRYEYRWGDDAYEYRFAQWDNRYEYRWGDDAYEYRWAQPVSYGGTVPPHALWDDSYYEYGVYPYGGAGYDPTAAIWSGTNSASSVVSPASTTSGLGLWSWLWQNTFPSGATAVTETGYRIRVANGQATPVAEVGARGEERPVNLAANEQWLPWNNRVVQLTNDRGMVDIGLWRDDNGNGIFQERFSLTVAANQGMATGALGWGSYPQLINGVWWAVQSTPTGSGGVSFTVWRDDNRDGTWTKIAEGTSQDEFLLANGMIDLVGLVNAGAFFPAAQLVG